MKLYFTCPKSGEQFATDSYTLQKDYRILAAENGGKTLQGSVVLDAGCPFCGEKHAYEAESIGCPLDDGKNET